ncbi:MAG: tetratricopeptide repeat protein [Planctomycetes bacterium]|nr:tetratricopeptide repeat protein [Planctomycetota bacterium]
MTRRRQQQRKHRGRDVTLPVVEPAAGHGQSRLAGRPGRRNYARWRAISLSLVYIAFALHILHWKLTGQTLAPLELNEVMYTLELGIITAGFLFMSFLVLGTMVFGRFFCSWACHILVLQDFCAWILRKLGIRRKPIRSRLLLFVAPLTALYMFVWPQVVRMWHDQAFPTFHFATDRQGWASFVTNHFWRNLPSAGVIVLTFFICGFLIVYLLGSRTFCTYVCPYGAIFSLADRFAVGRILVSDACKQCGTCTAACTSGIRVHEEVKQHGMIVNPACMKDLDCISACPEEALHYGLAKPSLLKSMKSGGRFGLKYDFSFREELLIASVFLFVLLSFRGLYSTVPFLLSLAIGAIVAYWSVIATRMLTKPNVRFGSFGVKRVGRITPVGRLFVVSSIALAAFVVHSGFVRYHEYTGIKQARRLLAGSSADEADEFTNSTLYHLGAADRWGLAHNPRVQRYMLDVAARMGRIDDVRRFAARQLRRNPNDLDVRLRLARALGANGLTADAELEFATILGGWDGSTDRAPDVVVAAHEALGTLFARTGRFAQAEAELVKALGLNHESATAHAELGSVLAETGRLDEAINSLTSALSIDPRLGSAQYNLGTILAHLGRFGEAIPYYERAIETGAADGDVHNNLGFALLKTGRSEEAGRHFERAIALNPKHAAAHFNLAALYESNRRTDEAAEHYQTAARLDPRYAQLIGLSR